MKRLLALILLIGIIYGGWVYYQSLTTSPRSQSKLRFENPKISLQDPSQVINNLESVLGASIENGVNSIQGLVTDISSPDQAPIINKAIENFQNELKSLPEDQVKKIQYNYCKTIVNEYEKQ